MSESQGTSPTDDAARPEGAAQSAEGEAISTNEHAAPTISHDQGGDAAPTHAEHSAVGTASPTSTDAMPAATASDGGSEVPASATGYEATGYEAPASATGYEVPASATGTDVSATTAATVPVAPVHTPPAASPHTGYPTAPPVPGTPSYATAAAPAPAYVGAGGGQSFGPAATAATGAQPTLPLGPAAYGTNASARPAQKKSGASRVAGLIVAAALVGGAAGLGGAYAGTQLWAQPSTTVVQSGSTVTVNNPDSVNATTAVAAKVTPSVVTIEVTDGSTGGSGSGVILSEDGYIVTNTHVVTLDGATADPTIRVTTSDGHIYDAVVVGTDATYDLAVIKLVDASGLTPIEFGDSSALNVGDQTVAIGAPLGLSNTVTTGIVSALNRSISIASSEAPDSESTDPEQDEGEEGPFQFDIPGQEEQSQSTSSSTISIAVIQTDAAINPGNSGGALVNSEGELIGINVAIATTGSSSSSDSSGSIGVGFSIPSNIVERVTTEIIEDGEATHGLLGASVQAAADVEGTDISGAYIAEVTDGGAAQAAGLQEGDIVTAFNGVPITDSVDLTAQVRAAAAGSDATVTFVRDGQTQSVDVTLGSLE